MSEARKIHGFPQGERWRNFHAPLAVTVEEDIDYGYRAFTAETYGFGAGPTPEAAIEKLQIHLGVLYEAARWAVELVER